MTPNVTEREKEILSVLADDPSVGVTGLAGVLGVSHVSVRSYLNTLEEKGYLVRTHGGAVATFHPRILERQHTQELPKRLIAKTAASMVADGDTIMIEAGTTTALIARYLLGRRDVMVVTNNALALSHSRGNPGLRVTMIGGEYRPATESLVGPLAVEELSRFHVRLAFVGTDGFTLDAGFTTHLVEGAEIVRKMASQAETTVAVADSSKFGKVGFVRVLGVSDIDVLITDSGIPEDVRQELVALGVDVRVAEAPVKEQ
ncbi:MAG: DeoR/GlpR family DNA-binding transcription regulator [Alkalispirochaeta sp.]|jgi:DeoR family galactitol utilization operon repressor